MEMSQTAAGCQRHDSAGRSACQLKSCYTEETLLLFYGFVAVCTMTGSERQSHVPGHHSHWHYHIPGQHQETDFQMVSSN